MNKGLFVQEKKSFEEVGKKTFLLKQTKSRVYSSTHLYCNTISKQMEKSNANIEASWPSEFMHLFEEKSVIPMSLCRVMLRHLGVDSRIF